ncbi:RNA polymerase sigma factor region1.1 domain-containing protein, partial [Klebsiella pneumoniae]|uniref:RNA polymerase sigma factor region1.1 domain-containing protein n=1 Tax=Klebsiella pneumoniae TaxID=573 RepID=UPI0027302A0A
ALDLAKEKQGKLTYDDLNEVMPEGASAEDIDEMMVMLSGMDIDIVDEFRVDSESQKKQQQREKQQRRAQAKREAAQTRLER